jgi:hypothetical protein
MAKKAGLALLALFALVAIAQGPGAGGGQVLAFGNSEKANELADKAREKAKAMAYKARKKAAALKKKAVEIKEKVKASQGMEKVKAAAGKAKTRVKAGYAKSKALVAGKLASLKGEIHPTGNYYKDMWNPIHFKPAIDKATNKQCLSCHQEIMTRKPRKTSPAGVKASDSLAWYQTLDTYEGEQMTFHARHLTSKFAKQVMDLKCTFCHRGNDPREEVPNSHKENYGDKSHVMRKMVDPAETCLRCHGKFPYENMEGVEGPWRKVRADLEDESDPDMRNGCMSCHKETYRTVRHQVNYLKAENIEKLANSGSSDVCYGCHGGRQWYRISYPYPRHAWPGMKDIVEETPAWAKNRPTESKPRDRRAAK